MDRRRSLSRALLLSPFVLWTFFFLGGPFLILALTSFYRRTPLGVLEPAFQLDSYIRLADPLYFEIVLRSVGFAFGNALICLWISVPVAYFLSRVSSKWRPWALSAILVPMATSFMVRIFALMDVMRLEPLGVEWIYTAHGVLVAMVYNYLPFSVLPLYAAFSRFDHSLIEAAQDLGASGRHILIRIIVPIIKPALVSGAVFVFIPSLGEFLIPNFVGGSKYFLIGNFLTNQFLTARNWPLGAAMITVIVILTLLTLSWLGRIEREKRQCEL